MRNSTDHGQRALPTVRQRGAVLLGFALAFSGCAVGPDFKAPKSAVNGAWSARSDPRIVQQAAADASWWKTFKDPALDRLVDLAQRQNLPLQVTGLRIVEARAQVSIAVGNQFPQLQVAFGSATVQGLSRNAANFANADRRFLDYQVGFDAVWELDLWGKYRRGVEAETAALLATVTDYYYAIVSLTAEVARTYAAIRTFEVLIAQAQQNAVLQEEGLRIAESRFRNGVTSELDVFQATSLLESTRASVPDLQTSLQQTKNALSTLLGQTTGGVDGLLVGPQEIPRAPAQVAMGMPAEMLRRRPDILSVELSAAAQCARIGVAKAELYPSFSLFGTIGLQASTSGVSKNLFSEHSLFYAAGPQINWPFFNYGRLTNNVRVEDARLQQLLVNYRQTVLRAAQEVEDALVGFLNAQDATAFEERSVTAAARSVELAAVQYQSGAVDYQRVLDAQRFLLQQQNNLAQSRSSIATNLIALYKALGGGWEMHHGRPVVSESLQQEMKERTNWGDMLSDPRSVETQYPTPRNRRGQ